MSDGRTMKQVPVAPSGIDASPRLPSLPAARQAQVLDTLWTQLGASARRKLCAQSASAGSTAMTAPLAHSGRGSLDKEHSGGVPRRQVRDELTAARLVHDLARRS